MGRGRVVLRRIENKISRQVTFSKRRSGLLKKAHEISVLCDADVAVIVFSAKGKLYEFSTNSRMDRIVERYENYTNVDKKILTNDSQENWSQEHPKLLAKIDFLQRSIRHLRGEDLDSLSLKELQNIEQQLETALKCMRTRKNQLMNEFISELQKKEKTLQEHNNSLAKKIKQNEEALPKHANQEHQESQNGCSSVLVQEPLLQPPPPYLTLGGVFQSSPQIREAGPQTRRGTNTLIPPWMLGCVNE